MKRLLFLLSAAAIGTGVMAQGEGLKFGAKAGLNMTNILQVTTFDIDYLPKTKPSIHLGGMMNVGFGRNGNFSLAIDLLYSRKGAKVYDVDDNGDEQWVPFNLSYIDLPITPRYRFKFGGYLETGPYLGFRLGASRDGETEYDTVNSSGDEVKRKYKEDTKGMDFGWTYGFGYIHESGLGAGFRGALGFMNIDNPEDADAYGDETYIALNRGWQLSFMYYFGWND